MEENPLLRGLTTGRQAPPFVLFIFGVTGDLTRSKLVPALFNLFRGGSISRFKIVGFARRSWGTDGLRERVTDMISDLASPSDELRQAFVQKFEYIQSTFEDDKGYREIPEVMKGFPNRIYYLSTPPNNYDDIIGKLGSHGLARAGEGYTHIVVEKPFGRDLQSARELNRALAEHFDEEQIFRIDHYLGKETVQNLLVLRFGNSIFEPIWNNRYIDHIQISVAEKSGVGTRGGYYDRSGALRDMVQNHLFQLMTLTTMEPPNDLGADTIRGEKVKIAKSLRPITHRDTASNVIRAQYDAGIVDGERVPRYLDEDRVSAESRTETYVALRVFLDTWRWSGVPIYLRSGKRLSRKLSEISVHFKPAPLGLFRTAYPRLAENTLIIRIQPDEGLTVNLNAKIPGGELQMRPVNMDFSYGSAFGEETPDAYVRLLLDAIIGDSTLYTRRDEIEASWTFITRILQGWAEDNSPIPTYVPGSSGPDEAKQLLSRDGRRWRKL
jgi:glucose-6-phosphate 1-dehydrogenase